MSHFGSLDGSHGGSVDRSRDGSLDRSRDGSLDGSGDLVGRIYRELRRRILDGELRPEERLPPTREMARTLGVSRTTVTTAYERLCAEGFAAARVGAGTFVRSTGPAPTHPTATPPPGHTDPEQASGLPYRRRPRVRPRPIWATLPTVAGEDLTAPPYDFRVGVPDAGLFPYAAWRRLVSQELRPSRLGAARYADPGGHAGLRSAIARHIGGSRSVRATSEDILVTNGAQQALDLVARVLLTPGDCVAVEDPGYPTARRLFQSFGAHVVGVPVDEHGLEVGGLPARARLVYVTPSHQFPLGTAMSLPRRLALLRWAEQSGAVVVEDDYDSEFRYAGRPLEPLHNLDGDDRVIYVGSFSKTLLPMLRVGFLVMPPWLRRELRSAKQLSDWHGDLITQGALAHFIDDGLLARHVRRAAREYDARRIRVLAGLSDELSRWLTPIPATAGLHLCTRVDVGSTMDVGVVVRHARTAGVALQALNEFRYDNSHADPWRPGARDGIVFGYGAVDPSRIDAGLERLAASFRHTDAIT